MPKSMIPMSFQVPANGTDPAEEEEGTPPPADPSPTRFNSTFPLLSPNGPLSSRNLHPNFFLCLRRQWKNGVLAFPSVAIHS